MSEETVTAPPTPGQALYVVLYDAGPPEWEALGGWQRERLEAAAQAATDAAPVDPADLLTAAERARDEAIDDRDSLTERVAELVTEGNDLRKELAEVRAALAEALEHVEPVDQNSEHAIARWQELARPEAGHA